MFRRELDFIESMLVKFDNSSLFQPKMYFTKFYPRLWDVILEIGPSFKFEKLLRPDGSFSWKEKKNFLESAFIGDVKIQTGFGSAP